MPRMDKLSSYRTAWETEDLDNGETRGSVIYATTRIVNWRGHFVRLQAGGHISVTTKRKMNQASNQFCLGYSVYQRKGEWFVDVRNTPSQRRETGEFWRGLRIPFYEGIMIDTQQGIVCHGWLEDMCKSKSATEQAVLRDAALIE